MRVQSKRQVTVRGVVIGGNKPLICLPIVADTTEKVLGEAKKLSRLLPDLLEWRIDGFENVKDIDAWLCLLKEFRSIIGEIPLIFTCRIGQEGGIKEISSQKRLDLITAAMATRDVDIVDVELCNDKKFLSVIRNMAKKNKVKLIFSYHNFTGTPSKSFIYAKLLEAQNAGADISKLAVMPNDYSDVLTLLAATNQARNEVLETPLVTMSMGEEGAVSRLAGGVFGSDITFAIGMQASAPGQIPIKKLKAAMDILYAD